MPIFWGWGGVGEFLLLHPELAPWKFKWWTEPGSPTRGWPQDVQVPLTLQLVTRSSECEWLWETVRRESYSLLMEQLFLELALCLPLCWINKEELQFHFDTFTRMGCFVYLTVLLHCASEHFMGQTWISQAMRGLPITKLQNCMTMTFFHLPSIPHLATVNTKTCDREQFLSWTFDWDLEL